MHPLVTCPLGFSKRTFRVRVSEFAYRVRASEFGMIANGFLGV